MDTATAAILIAGATLLLNLGIHIYGGGWNLSSKLATMEQSLSRSIVSAKDEVEERLDTAIRQVGETIHALRQHHTSVEADLRQRINDVQLEAAQTYMRRESFYQVKGEMMAEVKELGKELKERLDNLDKKIDTKT